MKEWIKKYTVYIVIAMMYYCIPLYLVKDTGSGIFLLLMVIPIFVFLISLVFAIKNGFRWYFSIVLGLLWIPNLFLLNDSATIYILMYSGISFIGQFVGIVLKNKVKK
ncbi:hypothetical protein NQ540_03960 [Granulicatella adiacens ATCC 49175]|uniref:Exosortase n=1 Tax=Granulicatella adiacens ATCC 49175 TaxID=638301 RepID=C8NE65_9LACT|nr:hypothetical protein [Granulicatella adiacens]EEW37966.1 hypothetical protein HMPREF0444_0210 [Granulicatella adiacens ATCC 49175]UAK93901.1 hypothetical protein K8O88_00925 [Granulicatella adiacens]UWP38866.1 hypothetical protein NQ540_03960 [Granulicatella adiacens ATCC 49175]